MKSDQNELITRIGPGTGCGAVLRSYWQPVALVDEFDPRLDPRMAQRPVKAVRVLGQDLVLFRDASGRWGLLDRDCPHRGADLSFGRHEGDGLRCPFHGWKFDATGRCLETPAEPAGSKLCERVQQRSYPVIEKSGASFRKRCRKDGCAGSIPTSKACSQLQFHSPLKAKVCVPGAAKQSKAGKGGCLPSSPNHPNSTPLFSITG